MHFSVWAAQLRILLIHSIATYCDAFDVLAKVSMFIFCAFLKGVFYLCFSLPIGSHTFNLHESFKSAQVTFAKFTEYKV